LPLWWAAAERQRWLLVSSLYTSGTKRASLRCSLSRDWHLEKRFFWSAFLFYFLEQKSVIDFLKTNEYIVFEISWKFPSSRLGFFKSSEKLQENNYDVVFAKLTTQHLLRMTIFVFFFLCKILKTKKYQEILWKILAKYVNLVFFFFLHENNF